MARGRDMRKQRGMTLIGMVFVAFIAGVFVLAALRLTPIYLEYMNVHSALNSMKQNLDGSNASPGQIRSALQNQFDIDNVQGLRARDITVERTPTGYNVRAAYEGRTQFIGNVHFLVEFDKSVEVVR